MFPSSTCNKTFTHRAYTAVHVGIHELLVPDVGGDQTLMVRSWRFTIWHF